MLKDLFCNIWYDEMGSGWLLLTVVLFLLSIAFLTFNFARIKAKNENFRRKHLIYLCLIAVIMYQIIPVSIHFSTMNSILDDNMNKAIQIEQIAIKTSIIPWQKGAYYCNLATLHSSAKDYNTMYKTYDIGYKYLKSYKCPCWGISYLSFYTNREFDTAIEIAKNFKGIRPFGFISHAYLMKGDIQNAELYIDKDIQQKETYSNLAIKAYILKIAGNETEAFKYYQKAKVLCKNEKEQNITDKTYKNFVEYENNRINALRQQQGLE